MTDPVLEMLAKSVMPHGEHWTLIEFESIEQAEQYMQMTFEGYMLRFGMMPAISMQLSDSVRALI